MADFAVIGHIAIDRIITSRGCRRQLGGSPAYVSIIARRLGLDAEVVTKVGGDLPAVFHGLLKEFGVYLQGQVVECAPTTRINLDYRWDERRLSIECICEGIWPGDVLELPEAALISPIISEVPPSTYSVIAASLIALDPQGFVREVCHDGSIRPMRWFDKGLLSRVDIYKSSENELRLITGEDNSRRGLRRILDIGAEIAIATKGAEGVLMMTRGGMYSMPTSEVVEVIDPTGAGDAFMGGFISEYLRGGEAQWCAAVGSAAASCIVETAGVSLDVSARKLRCRAEKVYNEIVRL